MVNNRARSGKERVCQFIAYGFGSGFSPRAPGTFGSLVGLLVCAIYRNISPSKSADESQFIEIFAILALSIIGWYAIKITEEMTEIHDDPRIVIDEIAGQWIALLPLKTIHFREFIVGFILFRFFDIVKPWPIRWLDEKLNSAFGTLVDDLVAGLFAAIVLVILMRNIF